jgi:UDP-N-acetylmuramate--alanine ligase
VSDAPWAGRRLHLVGIGGAGMSGYARCAVALGAQVSGSDRAESAALAALRAEGVDARAGHDAANLPDGDDVEVFHSSAIPEDNPERAEARRRGLPDQPRAALLEAFSALKRTIAVAGAHGKTTTTSMLAHALLALGAEPSYLIGGDLRSTGRNAEWRDGEWLVVEADESDRSMLSLHVDIAVVLNVELDHHATYASLAELREVYDAFTAKAATVAAWTPPAEPLELLVPGEHNQGNAAAALAAMELAGFDRAAAAAALATFPGAGRRFETVGSAGGAQVVDDYAHHPTEVAATIAAARTLAPRRVVAVFQPHLFSRTAHLHREFGAALAAADVVALLDVYPARERAEDFPGVTGLLVAEAAADAAPGREVLWLRDHDTAVRVLAPRLRAGDLVLTMGAGDVTTLGPRLVAAGA